MQYTHTYTQMSQKSNLKQHTNEPVKKKFYHIHVYCRWKDEHVDNKEWREKNGNFFFVCGCKCLSYYLICLYLTFQNGIIIIIFFVCVCSILFQWGFQLWWFFFEWRMKKEKVENHKWMSNIGQQQQQHSKNKKN